MVNTPTSRIAPPTVAVGNTLSIGFSVFAATVVFAPATKRATVYVQVIAPAPVAGTT